MSRQMSAEEKEILTAFKSAAAISLMQMGPGRRGSRNAGDRHVLRTAALNGLAELGVDSYLQDVRTRLEYAQLGISLDVGEGRQVSGPYLPPQQPTWRPGYIGSGNGKKGRRGAGTAEDEVVSVPDYAKARADFFADEDVDTNQKPAASGGAGNASSVEGAETDGTGAATDYTKLRENFFGGSLKKNGSEKAEMAELRRRRISKERAEAEEAAKRTREAEEATQEELRRRLAQEEAQYQADLRAEQEAREDAARQRERDAVDAEARAWKERRAEKEKRKEARRKKHADAAANMGHEAARESQTGGGSGGSGAGAGGSTERDEEGRRQAAAGEKEREKERRRERRRRRKEKEKESEEHQPPERGRGEHAGGAKVPPPRTPPGRPPAAAASGHSSARRASGDFDAFSKSTEPICHTDVPWLPPGPLCIFRDLGVARDAPLDTQMKALRRKQLQWHPDKWLQRWGERLQRGGEVEGVMRDVTDTARRLNALRATLK